MDSSAKLDPDTLLAHAGALRALARGLAGGDAHAAEDLVQETWVRALERPPRHADKLRAWLAAVLASRASKRRRADARRAIREPRGARPEALEGDAELALELEDRKRVLRLVSDALLALEEPYQSTLLLRYFEGLTPLEIASRTRAPVATVKSRLQRGLARLRAELDESERAGELRWMPALCALTGLKLPPASGVSLGPAATLGMEAIAMSHKTKLALGALALLLLGLGTWRALMPGEHSRGLERTALRPPPPPRDTDLGPEREQREAVEPERIASSQEEVEEEPQPDEPEPAHEHVLVVQVSDQDDLPLEGARVFVAPERCPLNEVGETDADGRLELRWLARERSMEVALLVVHDAWGASGLRRIRTGSSENHFPVQLCAPAELARSLADLGTTLPTAGTGTGLEPEARRDEEGRLVFADPWSQDALMARLNAFEGLLASEPAPEGRERERARPASGIPGAAVRGTVFDSEGAPCAGVPVVAQTPDGRERTASDERGLFGFDELEPGTLVLRAGGRDHAVVEQRTEARAGLTVYWDARLRGGRELEGQVIERTGAPSPGWTVELRSNDGHDPYVDTTVCADDGTFAFRGVAGSRLELALRRSARPGEIPLLLEDARFGRALELRVDERMLPSCSLEVLLTEADGGPALDGEVRLWMEKGGHGQRLASAGDGRYLADSLPRGRYRIEASRTGATWVERGVLISGEAREELALEPLGRLVVAAPARGTPVRWVLTEEGPDVERFVMERESTAGFELPLRAGHFALRSGERTLRFEVRPGEVARVGP